MGVVDCCPTATCRRRGGVSVAMPWEVIVTWKATGNYKLLGSARVGSLEFLHSMTIDAICSHQVSAVGTTQRLQHDQALPLSVKGVLTRLGKGLDLGG